MSKEFNLDKIYSKKLSKKELIRVIRNAYDKDFLVFFLPRTKNNADILIRSLAKELELNKLKEEQK